MAYIGSIGFPPSLTIPNLLLLIVTEFLGWQDLEHYKCKLSHSSESSI